MCHQQVQQALWFWMIDPDPLHKDSLKEMEARPLGHQNWREKAHKKVQLWFCAHQVTFWSHSPGRDHTGTKAGSTSWIQERSLEKLIDWNSGTKIISCACSYSSLTTWPILEARIKSHSWTSVSQSFIWHLLTVSSTPSAVAGTGETQRKERRESSIALLSGSFQPSGDPGLDSG